MLGSKRTVSSEVDVLEAGEMGKRKDLSDKIVMARQRGESISKTTGLVRCSQYAVVSGPPTKSGPRRDNR